MDGSHQTCCEAAAAPPDTAGFGAIMPTAEGYAPPPYPPTPLKSPAPANPLPGGAYGWYDGMCGDVGAPCGQKTGRGGGAHRLCVYA